MQGDAPDGPALNILQVLRAPVGGLFRHVRDLTSELTRRGHRLGVVVDSLASDGLTESRLKTLAQCAELGVHRIAIPQMPGREDFSAPGKIQRLIGELGIDVVHGHGAKGGFHARMAAWRAGVPGFYTPHGGVLHFSKKTLQGAVFLFVERRMLKRTAGIFFESAYARDTFIRQVAPAGTIGRVVHNGLIPEEFEPIGSSGEFDFVFVGELRPKKGVDVLLDALGGLVRRDGQPPKLLVVGEGPHVEALRVQIVRSRLSGQVRFAGALPAREAFARGDCVVVPSRHESLPYVALEAAAADKPLIATRVGGIAEIFGPTDGRLVPADDAAAMQAELSRWLTQPDDLKAEARVRRTFVRQHFRVDSMAAAIENGYRRALEFH